VPPISWLSSIRCRSALFLASDCITNPTTPYNYTTEHEAISTPRWRVCRIGHQLVQHLQRRIHRRKSPNKRYGASRPGVRRRDSKQRLQLLCRSWQQLSCGRWPQLLQCDRRLQSWRQGRRSEPSMHALGNYHVTNIF
jgi:hypothetical protein